MEHLLFFIQQVLFNGNMRLQWQLVQLSLTNRITCITEGTIENSKIFIDYDPTFVNKTSSN